MVLSPLQAVRQLLPAQEQAGRTPLLEPQSGLVLHQAQVGFQPGGIVLVDSEMVSKVEQITNGAASVQDPLEAAESVIKELAGKAEPT